METTTGSKIKLLPQALANKIAAGEVVSRPESVVKELMENAIDAGADNIILLIKEAGKSLIQVIDNGGGMSEEDALMSFQRHSTSKIKDYEDLENIQTLGFRGEALASICSISQVEMKTRRADDEIGVIIKIDGNEFKDVSKVSCDKGTSIAVKNLFYNTPGRRNFLKSNQTEFRHIYESFIKCAVSYPEIRFEFYNNDELIFSLKPGGLKERLSEIFTPQFTDSLIEVSAENSHIKVYGYISKPNFTRKAKQDQYFYINNRSFFSKALNYSVYTGYDDLIDKGDYPSFFIFIELDPKKVDVNVHPSKLEVKFEDERPIFGFIHNAVKDGLRKADLIFTAKFDADSNPGEGNMTYDVVRGSGNSSDLSNSERSTLSSFRRESSENFNDPIKREPVKFDRKFYKEEMQPDRGANIYSIFDAVKKDEDDLTEPSGNELPDNTFEHKRSEESRFNVWQFQNKYVLCQTESGLIIIDQHAAHERILYEKAVLWLESQSPFSQQLLIPLYVTFTKIDFEIFKSLQNEIQHLGFNFNLIKNESIELTGVPSDIKHGKEEKILQELIDQFKEYEMSLKLEKRDNLAKSYGCRSAIKAGDSLKYAEMIQLIDDLFACKMPYVCPHGRPTIIRITTEELDKRFSRT
ncbi:DNA mismatch repair endonuclease MutL [soil metagenome]